MRAVLPSIVCGVLILQATRLHADDASSACVQLAAILADKPSDQLATALAISKQVPAGHAVRPIADQATALCLISNKQYSQAWQQLASDPGSLNAARPGIRLQHDKLRLWLLLEAKSASADAQFKQLVSQSLNKEVLSGDRDDVWAFLGATVCMLESAGKSSPVQPATLQTTKAFIEESKFKSARMMFTQGYELARTWSSQLEQHLQHGSKEGVGQLEQSLILIDQKEAELIKKISELELEQKRQMELKAGLEDERTLLVRQRTKIQQEMRLETPGKPNEPSPPRNPSSSGSESERRREEKQHDKAFDKYMEEHKEFERKYAIWLQKDQARRQQLQQFLVETNQLFAAKTQAAKSQLEIAKKANANVDAEESTLKELRQSRKILLHAIENAKGKNLKFNELVRPSQFPLIDYQRESSRLNNSLRKL